MVLFVKLTYSQGATNEKSFRFWLSGFVTGWLQWFG
jgi:hypothetical protein